MGISSCKKEEPVIEETEPNIVTVTPNQEYAVNIGEHFNIVRSDIGTSEMRHDVYNFYHNGGLFYTYDPIGVVRATPTPTPTPAYEVDENAYVPVIGGEQPAYEVQQQQTAPIILDVLGVTDVTGDGNPDVVFTERIQDEDAKFDYQLRVVSYSDNECFSVSGAEDAKCNENGIHAIYYVDGARYFCTANPVIEDGGILSDSCTWEITVYRLRSDLANRWIYVLKTYSFQTPEPYPINSEDVLELEIEAQRVFANSTDVSFVILGVDNSYQPQAPVILQGQ